MRYRLPLAAIFASAVGIAIIGVAAGVIGVIVGSLFCSPEEQLCIGTQGPETGQGWQLEPGNPEKLGEYWGLRPKYCLIPPPRISPQDCQVPVSMPGLLEAS